MTTIPSFPLVAGTSASYGLPVTPTSGWAPTLNCKISSTDMSTEKGLMGWKLATTTKEQNREEQHNEQQNRIDMNGQKLKRFFFLVEESSTPLELTVTPCASPVDWSLHRKPPPPEDFYDEPRVDPYGPFQQRRDLQVSLGNWSEDRRRTYRNSSAAAGLYMVQIKSTRSDSIVHLLATTTGNIHPVYPTLPSDRQVQLVGTHRRTFTFRWSNAAPANVGRHVEYCLVVTKVRNFRTHCGFMAHYKGDKKPVLSPSDEWGFPWEKEAMRNLRSRARPVKPMSPRKLLLHQCVGSKKEFTFKKARKGKTYYVDVYVVDKDTNKTTAYEGTMVKMPGKDADKKPFKQILDGERKTLKLKKSSIPQMVTFEAKQQMPLLSVELGVCAGKIPVEILHNNKRVHRSIVRRWKRVRMKNVLPGNYSFKFPRLHRRKAFVSVYVTSRPSDLALPQDMSIKVFDSMTTCNNLTVAWMGTHKKQKYCLYIKEASLIRSFKRHRCSSVSDRPKSERVLCVRYRNRDVNRAVMTGTVTGLKPRTNYVLDVYLSRGHSGPVPYKSIKVKTKAIC